MAAAAAAAAPLADDGSASGPSGALAAIPSTAVDATIACADALHLVRWYSEVVGTWGSLVDHSKLKWDVHVAMDHALDTAPQSGAKSAVEACVNALKLHMTVLEDVRLPQVDAMWGDPSIMPGAILVLTRQFAIDTFNMTRGDHETDQTPLDDPQRNILRMMDEALSMEEDGRSDFVHRVGTSVSVDSNKELFTQFIGLARAVVESGFNWTITQRFVPPPPQRELNNPGGWSGASHPISEYDPAHPTQTYPLVPPDLYQKGEDVLTLVVARGSFLRPVSVFHSMDHNYRLLVKCHACDQRISLSLQLASLKSVVYADADFDAALSEWQALARVHEHRLVKGAASGRSLPESGRAARLQAALKRHQ